MKRSLYIVVALVVAVILLGLGSVALERRAAVQAAGVRPRCLRSIRYGPSRFRATGFSE